VVKKPWNRKSLQLTFANDEIAREFERLNPTP